jgi:antitoxin ParD1/3/4
MSETEQITIALPRAMLDRLRGAVAAGQYASIAEAVETAMILWDADQHAPEPDVQTLRRLVDEGLASGEPLDAGEVFAALRARLSAPAAAE